jgi:hypothetical protein
MVRRGHWLACSSERPDDGDTDLEGTRTTGPSPEAVRPTEVDRSYWCRLHAKMFPSCLWAQQNCRKELSSSGNVICTLDELLRQMSVEKAAKLRVVQHQ